MDSTFDYLFKILVLGERGSGKSSVVLRLGRDEFHSGYLATIGVDFVIRTLDIDGKTVKVQLWDASGGRERFLRITLSYYRMAMGFMLTYDITDEESFRSLADRFLLEVEKNAPATSVKTILGTKSDLSESRKVSTERGQQLADKYGCKFTEVSAKTGHNLEKAFLDLLKDVKKRVESGEMEYPPVNKTLQKKEQSKKERTACF